jgi:hypothetical protein
MGESKESREQNSDTSEENHKTLPRTKKLVLRLGTSNLKMVALDDTKEVAPSPNSLARFLLDSPLALSEIVIQREYLRERFIEIQE